jgi:hypothetical protein
VNQPGVGRVGFDLLPQPQDVHIHGAVGDGAILPPDGVQQLLAAEDHARTAHQEFQQPELGGGQDRFSPIQFHLATAAVQLHAAGLQQRAGAAWLRNCSLMRAISSRTKNGFTT